MINMKKEKIIKALDSHFERWGRQSEDRVSWYIPYEFGVSIFHKNKEVTPIFAIADYSYEIYIKENILTVYDENAECHIAREKILLENIEKIGIYKEVREILGCYE